MTSPIRHIGYVVNGKLVHAKPQGELVNSREQPLHRQFIRDRMREDYAADLAQPYKNGEVNPEFIESFGRESAENRFSEQQINQAMGNL